MKAKVDVDLLRAHSPAEAVLKCKDNGVMVPHLLISGERDCIVDVSQSERFKSAYDEGMYLYAKDGLSRCLQCPRYSCW